MEKLTPREEELMRCFWTRGPLFVRELVALWPEPKPHFNTLSTMVRGLEAKGYVGHKAYGGTYQYYPLVSEEEFSRKTLKGVVSKYFDNSYLGVVSSLVREEKISVDDLRDLIRKNDNPMPTFLLYSLKAAGCLAVFYLFYKLLLSRDTLHRMNRVLLCGVLLLSFLLPLCVITVEKELPGVSAAGIDVIPENYFRRDMVFENRIPDDTRDLMITEEPEPAPEPFDWGVLLGIIYFAGVFATLGWTVCNIVRVVRMTRRGQRIPLGNGSVLVLSDRIRAPFSWMRYVVMSEEDYACGGGTDPRA